MTFAASSRKSSTPIAVVGGGLSGMIQALYLASRSTRKVLLIEQQPTLGGLFASEQSPFGPLDHGIHIIYETGFVELDEMIHRILPPGDWIELTGVRKDIAGNYFAGHLNTGSIFPDIRHLPAADYSAVIADFFVTLRTDPPQFAQSTTLREYFLARFGPMLCDRVLSPIAAKVWGMDPALVSPWAARIVHMTRLVMFKESIALALKQAPLLDQLIAYPEQLSLPPRMLSGTLSGFYPRRFGMASVIEALTTQLEVAGVEILVGASVEEFVTEERRVTGLRLKTSAGQYEVPVSHVLWTSPPPALAKLLGVPPTRLPHPPRRSQTVQLFVDGTPEMGELYYFYCYEPGHSTFRVSSSAAYCPAALTEFGHPLSVELHFAPADAVTGNAASALACAEVEAMGIVTDRGRIRHTYVHSHAEAFFVPTVENLKVMSTQSQAIAEALPENVDRHSQDLTSGRFYLADALKAALPRLQALVAD